MDVGWCHVISAIQLRTIGHSRGWLVTWSQQGRERLSVISRIVNDGEQEESTMVGTRQ